MIWLISSRPGRWEGECAAATTQGPPPAPYPGKVAQCGACGCLRPGVRLCADCGELAGIGRETHCHGCCAVCRSFGTFPAPLAEWDEAKRAVLEADVLLAAAIVIAATEHGLPASAFAEALAVPDLAPGRTPAQPATRPAGATWVAWRLP